MYFIDTYPSWGHYSVVASMEEPPPFKVDLYVYARYNGLLVEVMGNAYSLAAHHVRSFPLLGKQGLQCAFSLRDSSKKEKRQALKRDSFSPITPGARE